jgi:uncharacterized membrane protein YhaH (DUF805 family)
VNWYLAVLKNYAGFSGRAGRREFWMFYLFHLIIVAVLYTPAYLTGDTVLFLPFLAYFVATFVPFLAAATRRLHDTGRSGLWYLIILLPAIGGLILLVMLAREGQYGSNAYGEDPRDA